MTSVPVAFAAFAVACSLSSFATAQCGGPAVLATYPGPDGQVNAMTLFDRDGPGPAAPQLILAGRFSTLGDLTANNIAAFDLTTSEWSALGTGISGAVESLAVTPGGELIVGGSFTTAGSRPARRVARWNGSTWQPLGNGVGDDVSNVIALQSGDAIISGAFVTPALGITRWNATSGFSAFGPGIPRWVYAGAPLANGDFVIGGSFTPTRDFPGRGIARWNAATSTWSALGSGVSGTALALAALPNGQVIAAGAFSAIGGTPANNIAQWNGSQWLPLGAGVAGFPRTLAVLPNGELIVGGTFSQAGGVLSRNIARWLPASQSWTPFTNGVTASVSALVALPSGELAAAVENSASSQPTASSLVLFTSNGVPSITTHPASQSAPSVQNFRLAATVGAGYSGVRVQWFRNGRPVVNGPGGASIGGGAVSGATVGPLADSTTPTTVTLKIANPRPSDSGDYTVSFLNACGAVFSQSARISITPCTADFNTSGTLTPLDIFDYITAYFTATPTADINADATLSVQDIFDFLTAYFAGC